MSGWFSISEMATTYQTTFRTLRFYEQQGLLAPSRSATQRRYSAKDRIRLQLILTGRRLGFSLAEIKKLIEGMAADHSLHENIKPIDLLFSLDGHRITQRIELLVGKRDEIQSAIDHLKRALENSDASPKEMGL